jgi:hypothetical protein
MTSYIEGKDLNHAVQQREYVTKSHSGYYVDLDAFEVKKSQLMLIGQVIDRVISFGAKEIKDVLQKFLPNDTVSDKDKEAVYQLKIEND